MVRRGSEDLRAPGRTVGSEERVRTGESALGELVDEAGSEELGEREPAQVDGREVADVEGEVRRSGRPLGFATLKFPAAVVPGAEGVPDLEDERVLRLVRASGERSADVDEPQPEAVPPPEAHAPGVHEQELERMVDGEELGQHGVHQVDVEE